MKKYILSILLFVMFIPFMVNAETCDTNKITIENITIENKTDNVEELLLPNSFSFKDDADISDMFNNANIPSIDISGMDTSNVSYMALLFCNSNVEEIKLPQKLHLDSIKNQSGMYNIFSGITAKKIDLTSIDIEDKMIGTAILYKTNFDTIYVKSEEDAEWYRQYGDYNENNFNYVVKN